jgi:hypothetical protein
MQVKSDALPSNFVYRIVSMFIVLAGFAYFLFGGEPYRVIKIID